MTRLTVDRHLWRALLDGKASRAIRLGQEPKLGPATVFRHGHPTSVGRVQILDVTAGTLDQIIPDNDIKAALEHGAPTTTEFRRRWLSHHDRHVKRMTADQIADLTEHDIRDRWRDWRPVRVWDLSVVLDTVQRDRFLAARPHADRTVLTDQAGFRLPVAGGGDLARGYTTTAAQGLAGEGAAVDDLTLERFAAQAQDRDAHRRRQDLYQLEQQLLAAATLADTRDLHVIQKRLAAMRARRAA